MPTYTATASFDIPDFTPDLTQKLDVSLTGTRSCVEKINEYLTEADAAFKKGAPFPEKLDFLGTFEEIKELPFSTVTDFKIVVESMPIEHAGYAISLVAAINTAFPEIGVEGKCYNKKPAFGKRNIYNLQADCGVETLEIVQKYEDAMPGDTRVPDPTILDDDGKSAAGGTSEKEDAPKESQVKLVNKDMEGEPDYILANDKFNPMALLWLSQNGLLDIFMGWNSGRHNVSRFNYTDDTETRAANFVAQRDEIGQAPFALMNYLCEDEYNYPAEWVHSQLWEENNFPNGDVDIMTMLFLCRLGMWEIGESAQDAYEITIDPRLARGVPDAYTLLARLIWRMREYAEIEGPFKVSFNPKHLEKLDDYVSDFDGAAFGAQENPEPASMTIDAEPKPDPNGGAERPFAGGVSRSASGGFFTEGKDRSRIDDKELFIKKLRTEMKSFPKTISMNGGDFENKYASERIRLLPGDLVTLISKWNAKGIWDISGDVVGIKVYDRDKKLLGELMQGCENWELGPEDFGLRELACLLPYVTATVKSVDADAKDAITKVSIAFDRKGKSDDEIVDEILEDMKQPYAKRTKLSRGPLVASDILAQVEWSVMGADSWGVPDIVNPAPEGADNPQGERLQVCENVIAIAGKGKKMLPVLKKMKKNALKHIEMINDGWYYNEDQLKAAKTFEELHDAIWRDIREHFRNVFNLKPKASYVEDSGQLVQYGDGDRRQWILCYKTWNCPNDDDLKVFFDGVKDAKFGMVRLAKRELEKNVHVSRGVFTTDDNISDFLSNEELIAPKDLAAMREELRDTDIDSDDFERLALRMALLEVFGGYEELGGTSVSFGIADHSLFDLDSQPEEEVEAKAEAPAAEQLTRRELEELDPGTEPEQYVRNGKFEPLAAAWLFYNDYVFFKKDGISWDGQRHHVECVQINSKKADDIPRFMADAQKHVDLLVDFLNYLEDDREFVVPRSMIAPGLYGAIREGDLTGITFFNLIACGRAMKVEGQRGEDLLGRERDFFTVTCDERIAMGIPAMQDLGPLLAFDIRMYIDQPDCPQTVDVSAEKVRWADDYLGDVAERVEGSVLEGSYCMQHGEGLKPDVTLPGDPEDPNAINFNVTIDLAKLLEDMD